MTLAALPISRSRRILTKLLAISGSSIKIKVKTCNTFRNVAYFSSYLQTKSFTWKRDCVISSKLQMLQRWSITFSKALIKFYIVRKKDLCLNNPYNLNKQGRLILGYF